MPYIKTLKDRQDETVFPVTKADGVILNDNSSAQGRLSKAVYQADTVGEIEVEAWVDTDTIIDGAITEAKIDDGAVTENKISDGAVTENKISDGAVTEDKIADDSISNDKLQDESVSLANLIWPAIMNRMYPVGSIYMSATLDTAAKVQTAMGGGTWVAWGEGKVPVGVNSSETEFNAVEKTGGAKTHTLTTTEMPKHEHEIRYRQGGGAGNWGNAISFDGGSKTYKVGYTGNAGNGRSNTQGDILAYTAGGGGSHNNLQPYITCYMWKRTA